MNKTKYTCRQLNSKAIKSAALCFVSAIIVGKCSIEKRNAYVKSTKDDYRKPRMTSVVVCCFSRL